MNCGHGQHKNGYFFVTLALRTARWHNKTESIAIYTILQDESVREINLINDLDLQRLETGRFNVRRNSPTFLLLEVIEPFQEQFRNRQQTLRLISLPRYICARSI